MGFTYVFVKRERLQKSLVTNFLALYARRDGRLFYNRYFLECCSKTKRKEKSKYFSFHPGFLCSNFYTETLCWKILQFQQTFYHQTITIEMNTKKNKIPCIFLCERWNHFTLYSLVCFTYFSEFPLFQEICSYRLKANNFPFFIILL